MRSLRVLVIGLLLAPANLAAQQLSAGASRWLSDRAVMEYHLSLGGRSLGPLHFVPFGQLVFQGPRSDRAVLAGGGADARLSLPIGSAFLVGGVSTGFLDLEKRLGVGLWYAWSGGGGVELFRVGPAGVALEVRYQHLSRGSTEGVSIGLQLGPRFGRRRSPNAAEPAAGPATQPALATAPPPTESPPTESAPTERQAALIEAATAAMGAPYLWGGSDQNGFDCSGLIQHAYRAVGVEIPRTSAAQARFGHSVARAIDQLAPGDILAFSATAGGVVSHVGLYLGGGEFIHSATGGVRRSVLSADDPAGRWWFQRWVDARRILD